MIRLPGTLQLSLDFNHNYHERVNDFLLSIFFVYKTTQCFKYQVLLLVLSIKNKSVDIFLVHILLKSGVYLLKENKKFTLLLEIHKGSVKYLL